ncbi:MAG: amidophosphoribosyltransferase [Firmicutes bacterium]|nr:amidophosphoribosyltransferase [Bacillota bacterium]
MCNDCKFRQCMAELEIENKIQDECGVFGISAPGIENLAKDVYFGLHSLQHRGQDSAGIAANDGGKISFYKKLGLVTEVFNDDIMEGLKGDICVGHVRAATKMQGHESYSQPFVVHSKMGSLAIGHNGQLVNAKYVREQLQEDGCVFHTTSDAETIAVLIAKLMKNCTVEEAIAQACLRVQGAFALVITIGNKLIGVRDPHGIRPLCIGKTKNGYVISSESCAFPLQGAELVRDVQPGEIVVIENGEINSVKYATVPVRGCSFEYVYTARTDSKIDGTVVYMSRREAGRILAREDDVEADMVIAVPDSGTVAAIGYAEESGIPFGEGFVKSRYVGRTFIQPTQEMRVQSVKMKLNVLEENVRGKRIVMIDDSIVRGTTSDKIIKLLKDAGALEVHMRLSSPPVMYSCYMGTDTPDRKNLIAANMSIEEIRQKISADSLRYISIEGLKESIGLGDNICLACFTGEYPVELYDIEHETGEKTFVGEYD